jgi:hypothetical protein
LGTALQGWAVLAHKDVVEGHSRTLAHPNPTTMGIVNARTRWFVIGFVALAVFGGLLAFAGAGSVVMILTPLWLLGGLIVFIVRRIKAPKEGV